MAGVQKDRITNLKLAVAACDQVELQPGEIFSYNDTLGPRTAERGYKDATVIVNGKHALGIGGGICQISTTLFMACLESDLSIIERHNHAARIDYAEDGLDAAVVWGSQDFKFQNNTEYPIKLTASYDEKEEAVTVEIYGTKTDENTVEITTEPSGPIAAKLTAAYMTKMEICFVRKKLDTVNIRNNFLNCLDFKISVCYNKLN